MSDTPALVADTREALASAECSCGHPVSGHFWQETLTGCIGNWYRCPCGLTVPDALLASGVVTTAEAHREQIARAYALAAKWEAWAYVPSLTTGQAGTSR